MFIIILTLYFQLFYTFYSTTPSLLFHTPSIRDLRVISLQNTVQLVDILKEKLRYINLFPGIAIFWFTILKQKKLYRHNGA